MPNRKKIHEQFLQLLSSEIGLALNHDLPKIKSMPAFHLLPEAWQPAAKLTAKLQYRFVAIWAQDLGKNFELNVSLELHGAYLLLRTLIEATNPIIAAFTPYFPAANRLERHTHDMFGINFSNHPDQRRWTRHLAWSEKQFPLRKNFPVASASLETTLPDNTYPFTHVSGTGVYEIPVGPIHAGIIEPGHFRFQAAGEDIINLEERLGYVHKGIEKIAEKRNINQLIKLAGRVSGDSTVAHAWAACLALENATNLKVPERALYIRAIMCEHERIANHLGDFATVANDVAYTFAYYQLMRIKELWLRLNTKIFGHRLMMDCIIPGGVSVDLNSKHCQAIREQIINFRPELEELYAIFEENSGFHDRIKTTGMLSVEQATRLGVLGYVGRASGHKFDLRHDAPYPPYNNLKIRVPVFNTGDVLARLRVRAQEILVAFELIEQLLDKLPDDSIYTQWITPNATVEGIGLIEGWRGEVFAFVRIGNDGLVERYFPRDPSWFSWPALEQLIHGNIVPDFPVCNKSINGSYSAVDL
jgi:Ni,Fe-hydrogenase III large subunit